MVSVLRLDVYDELYKSTVFWCECVESDVVPDGVFIHRSIIIGQSVYLPVRLIAIDSGTSDLRCSLDILFGDFIDVDIDPVQ